MTAEERRWKAQADLSTLTTAAEIRADATRMKAAKAEANRQARAVVKATK
jgi:hypothetical protein